MPQSKYRFSESVSRPWQAPQRSDRKRRTFPCQAPIDLQHRESVRSELGFFRAGPSDRLRVKFSQSRLWQIELFVLGEFIDHGCRVAKMLYDNTGVQKKAISRRRHQSDRLPLARLSRKPRLPPLAYFRPSPSVLQYAHCVGSGLTRLWR